MKVIWSSAAEQDRAEIFDHVCLDSPAAAVRLDERIARTTATLAAQPRLGRVGRVAGTRELLVHEHDRVIYEIGPDLVWILAVVHTARMWPPAR